jgi:hypothetical protein
VAALRVTRISLATSTASAPRAAPRDESVMVDRKIAIAATPSMDTVMKAIPPAVRSASCSRLSGAPDSEVTAPPASWPPVGARLPGLLPAGASPTAAPRDGPSSSTPVA